MPVLEESKPETTLSPLEWMAVQLVGRHATNFRGEVTAGKRQPVDLLLRISGTIDVGEDGMTAVNKGPEFDNLLAHVLRRLTPSDWDQIRQSIVDEANANGGILPGCEEGYVAKAVMLVSLLTQKTISPRKGSTKGSFRVGQVDERQLAPSAINAVQKFTRIIQLDDVE